MNILWKDVKGFEGLYEISSKGEIYSYYSDKILKLNEQNKGYLGIDLWKNKQRYRKRVHRLVAEAFIPNPDKKPEVNHKDCNPKNNNIDNLEWVTTSENQLYSSKLGRKSYLQEVNGENSKLHKIVEQIDLHNDNIINIYYGTNEAHRQTNISQGNIAACCRGERKQAGGFKWRYKCN